MESRWSGHYLRHEKAAKKWRCCDEIIEMDVASFIWSPQVNAAKQFIFRIDSVIDRVWFPGRWKLLFPKRFLKILLCHIFSQWRYLFHSTMFLHYNLNFAMVEHLPFCQFTLFDIFYIWYLIFDFIKEGCPSTKIVLQGALHLKTLITIYKC